MIRIEIPIIHMFSLYIKIPFVKSQVMKISIFTYQIVNILVIL